MAQRIATADARKQFAKVVRSSADGERIKLTRYDSTQAVLIPKHDLERLEDCEASAKRAQTTAPPHRRRTRRRS